VGTPIETPRPVVKGRPFLGRHVADEGIREWFVREAWLLTDREVQRVLTLRRSVAARYYNEWGMADPIDLRAAPGGVMTPPETAPRELHSA
jgi:hypothetical protein